MIGNQFPTVSLVPTAEVNHWDDVRDLCKAYGLVLDPWQENVLRSALGERTDGLWAATRVGLSVPRQSGKTTIFEARELAGLLLFGEQLIIHSAHLVSTALEGFHRIKGYFENYDDLRRLVRRIREANGEQAVEMMSGQRLMFRARARGGGRGLSPDVLMMDEAQILPERALASALPSMSARPNPQAWLAGTPPGPEDDGETFGRLRQAGHDGEDERLCWMEWGIASGLVDVTDQKLWAQANPGLGIRITTNAISDEMHSMDPRTFARERLGMWHREQAVQVIRSDAWAMCVTTDPPGDDPAAFGLDMSHDRVVSVAVCVKGGTADHVEVAALDRADDPATVVEWVVERAGRRTPVVIDAMSPAANLIAPLKEHRVKVKVTTASDMAKACGSFYDAVTQTRLTHFDQAPLNDALAGARKRDVGIAGGWAWDRKDSTVNIAPLVSVTLAKYGADNFKKRTGRSLAGN